MGTSARVTRSNVKKVYKRKPRRRVVRPTTTRGIPSNPKNYQIINSANKTVIHRFKDTWQLNDIVGAGVSIPGLNTFQISQIGRYTALASMYRRYRIDSIKFRFRLNNVELTDNAELPTMYVRYNYNPDQTLGVMTEDYFLRQQNVIAKQFHHNTINGSVFTYTVKPAVMVGTQLYNSTNFVPSPVFNRWCDFDPALTTDEINHYGLQYFITNLPTGIKINLDAEVSYSCKDII